MIKQMDGIIPRYNFFASVKEKDKHLYLKSPDVDKNTVLFALFWGE